MIHGVIKAEFTTLKSGQVCRSPLAHALDEDGVQRLLNVHSMIQTLEAWILKKSCLQEEQLSVVHISLPREGRQ